MPVKGNPKCSLGVTLWKSSTAIRLGKADYVIMTSVLDMNLNSDLTACQKSELSQLEQDLHFDFVEFDSVRN